MSNGNVITTASLSLLAGSVVRGILALPVGDVCKAPRDVTFGHARSFIEPTPDNKAAFQNLITRLTLEANTRLLLVTGHTDSTGDAVINQKLSERRVRATWAVLRGDTAEWERLFTLDEGWGTPELIVMRDEAGLGGESDLSGFFGNSQHAKDVRRAMFTRYFAKLLDGRAVPAHTAATPDSFAYGKEQLLRGDPNNPSRDPTKPEIRGDFRPNRRSEFFSFKKGIPIVRDDYPKWAGKCTLTPPPVSTTVAIAPVETVGRNKIVEFDITVSPDVPPLSNKASISLSLSTTSGTGSAVFADNNSNVLTIRGSKKVKVRGVTASNAPNNVRLTATLIGQKSGGGSTAQVDFTVVDDIFIHLQFEVWDLTAKTFRALPPGVVVDIMDEDPLSNDRLISQPTNAQGRVLFNLPSLPNSGEATPDIFFLVHTRRLQHAGHTLPDEWSTSGWLAADNSTTGLTPNYAGTPIGTPTAPVVFRIGLDFHAKFTYPNTRTGTDELAPKQIPVRVFVARGLGDMGTLNLKLLLPTDDNGEIHGVIFDLDPGLNIWVNFEFEMTDASINLPRVRVHMEQIFWNSFFDDGDRKLLPNNHTSIGTQAAPEEFRLADKERNIALYFLKTTREWSIFLRRMTGGDWTGVERLTLFRTLLPFATVSHSFPVGEVHIMPSRHFNRGEMAHELSHQIMWKELGIGNFELAYLASPLGDFETKHRPSLLANPLHAVMEGWPDFIKAVFAGRDPVPYDLTTLTDKDRNPVGPLGPPPLNQGHDVEGAFANGLWAIFKKFVVTPGVSANAHVPESRNGDVLTTAAYLANSGVRDRFLSIIWNPFKAMAAPSAQQSTIGMIANIRAGNLPIWHALQPELQAFNMAMDVPTATAVSPPAGPPAGGKTVTIRGLHFTLDTTTVSIGGSEAKNVKVTNTSTLTAETPPGALGTAPIIVTTPAGSSAPLENRFTYAEPPVVTEVLLSLPAPPTSAQPSGPTTGGTSVTIRGRNFDLNAKVFFDGLPPGGVEATIIGTATPTEVPVLSPEFLPPDHVPKRVKVTVRNPDQQFGELDNSFDYVLGPAPRIDRIDPPSGPAGETTVITIHGANFILDRIQVFVDGVRNEDIDLGLSNATQIVTTAKALAPGVGVPRPITIRVFNLDGQEAIRPSGYVYV